jgi:hypothetical protein
MGTVPVAPNNSRIGPEGDRKMSGFSDKPVALGSNKMERMYMPTLIEMINLTNLFGSRNTRLQTLFFHNEAGLAVLQYGHLDSDALISFLQLGQRMDCR